MAQRDPISQELAADIAAGHFIHFKSLICFILDPSQPPCFNGCYGPRKIDRSLYLIIKDHRYFKSFCYVEERGRELHLWLKEEYTTQYSIWRQAHEKNDVERAILIQENNRVKNCIEAYHRFQLKRRNFKSTIDKAHFMVMEMIEEYQSAIRAGEIPLSLAMLTVIGYLPLPDYLASAQSSSEVK